MACALRLNKKLNEIISTPCNPSVIHFPETYYYGCFQRLCPKRHPMKTTLIPAALLFITAFSACRKCDDPVDPPQTNCETVFCTAEFAEVRLTVQNGSGQAVKLDSFFVTDLSGKLLPMAPGGIAVFGYPSNGTDGVYTVLNDAWRTGHQNTRTKVRAHGIKNSVEVLNEVYEIETDCCHVQKISGKDVVIVP